MVKKGGTSGPKGLRIGSRPKSLGSGKAKHPVILMGSKLGAPATRYNDLASAVRAATKLGGVLHIMMRPGYPIVIRRGLTGGVGPVGKITKRKLLGGLRLTYNVGRPHERTDDPFLDLALRAAHEVMGERSETPAVGAEAQEEYASSPFHVIARKLDRKVKKPRKPKPQEPEYPEPMDDLPFKNRHR